MASQTRPVIAIDVDDVLANSTEALRLRINAMYGAKLEPSHYAVPGDYWKYYERVWNANGLTDVVSKEVLNQQMVDDQSHIEPHADALDILRSLATDYRLIVITARNDTWKPATLAWLDRFFPDVFAAVEFGGQRGDPKNRTKADICREQGVSWLIDDNPEHCQLAMEQAVTPILFGTYGWNGAAEHPGMVRCKDWSAVKRYFDGLATET